MELNINSSEIDQYVKECLIKSTIGKTIEEAIQSNLKDLLNSYRSPITEYVQKYIEDKLRW